MFSSEICEIFKNAFFAAASEDQRKTRLVLSLKIIFLKELKFTDLCRSLLNTDCSFVMILSFHFSFT